MTERPILFSAPMVRALLAGTKTQTRRAAKLPHQNPLGAWEPIEIGGKGCYLDRACTIPDPEPPRTCLWHTRTADMIACPYGKTGDRLWVRESGNIATDKSAWMYPDTGGKLGPTAPAGSESWAREWKSAPSIHMPRWACRLVLEVIGIRVERLQDISEHDAQAEGIRFSSRWEGFGDDEGRYFHCTSARRSYEQLWEHINGADSWDANPWVWVVEFKTSNPVLPKNSLNR